MNIRKLMTGVATVLTISIAGTGLVTAAPLDAEARATEIERIRLNDKPLREDVIGNALIEGFVKGSIKALLRL